MFNQYKLNRGNFNSIETWETGENQIGVTIVRVRTRKWGTGAGQSTTSTGTSDSGTGYGYGGFDYNGDMGDAEYWLEE